MVRNIRFSTLSAAIALIAVFGLHRCSVAGYGDHVEIKSTGEYQKFRAGQYAADANTVYIDIDHPTMLLEPVHFVNVTQYQIRFHTKDMEITLYPKNKAVVVSAKKNATFAIPNDYKFYVYESHFGAMISEEALDFLVICQKAETIIIDGMADLTSRLSERADELENLKSLHTLKLTVKDPADEIGAFFEYLPALRYISFAIHGRFDADKFFADEIIPTNWRRYGDHNQANLVKQTDGVHALFAELE